ncbi:MAG: histidinol-phosphate transaminase [Pseudohongiellaceae bacterium]
MSFERSNIQAMTGYASGEQPDSIDVIKLNTNENPFPPGPGVAAALAAIQVENLRRYPPPTATRLRGLIATHHNIEAENVIVTNGGDELLRLAVTTFVEAHESIAVAEPSYSLYEVLANAHGCGISSIALSPDWTLPDDFAAQLNRSGAKLCFVVNPHAPSGRLTPVARLRRLAAEFRGVLVLDEAYVDFVDPAQDYNSLPLMKEFENLLILRTFSKGYSLAGLRIAYGIGARSLIDPIQFKTKDSYNTDFIAQTLACAALEDIDYAAQTWAYVRQQRSILARQLAELGLTSIPSESNFLLVTVPQPRQAENIYRELKARGVLVRYFNDPRLDDKLRISIGTAEENQKFISALEDIL